MRDARARTAAGDYEIEKINLQEVHMFGILLKGWKQASDLFSKKEILLFIFGWIRTFKRSFGVFLKYFWWLVAAEIICKTNIFALHVYRTPIMVIATILSMFSIFFSLLTVRASVEVKDVSYFVKKLQKLTGFTLLFIPLVALLTILIFFNTGISSINWALSAHLGGTNLLIQVFGALFLLISGFLIIDNQTTIHGIKVIQSTAKSIFMYLPVITLLAILYALLYYILGSLMSLIHPSLTITSILFLNFFFTCGIAVLYLKIKHRNHAMFFGNS